MTFNGERNLPQLSFAFIITTSEKVRPPNSSFIIEMALFKKTHFIFAGLMNGSIKH